jgi:hypothetical protein
MAHAPSDDMSPPWKWAISASLETGGWLGSLKVNSAIQVDPLRVNYSICAIRLYVETEILRLSGNTSSTIET